MVDADAEECLAAILDHAPFALVGCDLSRRVVFARGRALTPLRAQPSALVGHALDKVFPDVPELVRALDRALAGKASRARIEIDDAVLDVAFHPRRGPNDEIVGALIVAVDVTETSAAVERARVTAIQLSMAEQSAAIGAWSWTIATRELVCSTSLSSMLGLMPEPNVVYHRDFIRWVHPDDREYLIAELERAAREQWVGRIHVRFVRADGLVVHGELLVARTTHGDTPNLLVGIVRDLTGAQREKTDLVRALSLQRATLEATADGILVVDSHGKVRALNEKFIRLWRIPTELAASVDDSRLLTFILPQLQNPAAFFARVNELYEHPEMESVDEVAFADGRIFERYSMPHRLDGAVIGRVWSFRDVTRARRTLTERDELLRRAEDHVRMRDEFLAIAAHELNTPVTSLILAIQLLERRAKLPPDHAALLETASRQVFHLRALVNQLLDVSRIHTGTIELDLRRIDLAALVREVAARFAPDLRKAGCELTLRADHPVVGTWDKLRLEQVLSNLFSNAAKYGAGKPVDVVVSEHGGLARCAVTDRGIGIAADEVSMIFTRFYRGSSAKRYGGLGLGLFISREIAKALGGDIRVESRSGSGATFVIELPTGVQPGEQAGAEAHP
jgi:signal transduction histidine kinase